MSKIRVAIVEDDLNWLKAMKSFLNKEDDIIIVGTATSREESIKLIDTVDVDLIIMDINLNSNKCDGIYAAAEIMKKKKIKIIMLTSINEDEIFINSFTAGAVNLILKENYRQIPDAIRRAIYSKSALDVLSKELIRLKKEEYLKELSDAEREVFELLKKDYTRSQIAKKLIKSKNTVKSQIRSILKKLNVNSSKEAVEKINKYFHNI